MQIRMLREIDAMFEGAPQNRKTLEAKEEMLQNLMEKYDDLRAEGRSEEAAFNIAIGSVGDISDLIEELRQTPPPPKAASFPEPDLSDYEDEPVTRPAEDDASFEKHHKAVVVSVAVMLYILSPVAVIFFGGKFGLILLFVMIAAATGLLVYNGMTGAKKSTANGVPTMEEEMDPPRKEKMSKSQKHFFGSLSSALWLITVSLYFVISFSTGAWHITWIIFLISAAANNILKAFMDMYRK